MQHTVTELDAFEREPRLASARRTLRAAWRRTTAPVRRTLDRLKRFSAAFSPILSKELRIAARRKRTFVLRTVYVGLLAATVCMALYEHNQNIQMNPGLSRVLVGQIAPLMVAACGWFQLIAGTLIAPVLTSTAIAEERARRTLRMLLITPLSRWHIVASKLLAPVVQILVLIAASLPVLAIVQVYGGAGLGITLGITLLCLVNALFAASVGLLVSTYAFKLHYATSISYLVLLGCYLAFAILGPLANPFVAMEMISESMITPQSTWFGPWGTFWWIPCSLALLFVAFLITTLAAGRLADNLSDTETSTATAREKTALSRPNLGETWQAPRLPYARLPKNHQLRFEFAGPDPSLRPRTGRKSRIVGDNPIIWREGNRLRAQMNGEWITKGVPIYLGLALFMSLVARQAFANPLWHGLVTAVFLTILLLATALLAAPSITSEKETGCWRALLSTPLSSRKILFSKAWAVLQHVYPASLFALGHVLLFTVLWNLRPIVVVHAVWILAASVLFALGLAMAFSMRLRRTTTAVLSTVLTALGLWCAVPTAAGFLWGEDAAMSTLLLNPVYLMGVSAFGATRDLLPRTNVVYFSGDNVFTPAVFTLNVFAIGGGYLFLAACLFGICLMRFGANRRQAMWQ